MGFIHNKVTTRSGLEFPYIEQGNIGGSPVIFLHGVTDSHRSWELVFPHLSADIRGIAITQRGHGDASKPATGYSSSDLAGDVVDVMDALDIPSAVIVGHSMGSFAAQRVAIEHPERVDGLVLIGSFTTCSGREDLEGFLVEQIEPLTDPVSALFAEEFQSSTISKDVPDYFFRQAVSESTKVPAYVWKAAFRSMIEVDHGPELAGIDVETLLIWGDRDAYFSFEEQQRLLRLIKNSRLNIYEEIGHAPNWETPERVASDVVEFVHSVSAGRAATVGR